MTQVISGDSANHARRSSGTVCLIAALALMLCLSGNQSAQATTGGSPYDVPQVLDADGAANIVETWIVAEEATVDIGDGNGATTKGMAFKSCFEGTLTTCTAAAIPGPEFRLTVGDRVKVHFVNNLPATGLTPEANVSGIHWHGIELNNQSDGTELTQVAVDPEGGTFEYDFIVPRPGVYWYHPHHHSSTNQVAKGLYGSIVVKDNNGYEAALIANNVIPADDAAHTRTLVISDITVCRAPNPATFDDTVLPHVSGVQSWAINYQNDLLNQSPKILCDDFPMDANGEYEPGLYVDGDVPNIQSPGVHGRMSEGFTVLTNGVYAGARAGKPAAPGVLDPGAQTLNVEAGQGLRLQIVNPSPVRYLRLRLTTSNGKKVNLFRVGGEGGLLDRAILEGGVTASGFKWNYGRGEILLPPAGRADVVAKIPANSPQGSVLTLWTQDFQRVAATYSWTATVPVMHLTVAGTAAPIYKIKNGKKLLAHPSLGGAAKVQVLGAPTANLVSPTGEDGIGGAPAGSTNKDIQLTFFSNAGAGAFAPSVDGVPMPQDFTGGFGGNPFYLESARHATLDHSVELTVTNTTGANHPFHLHGFSVQPIKLAPKTGTTGPSYKFPHEFRDIVDVPANHTLTFRVSLDDRLQKDNVSAGGGMGRWLFHCHILPHATFGMMSELHVH